MYATKSPEPYRPVSVNRGVIPSLAQMDSGVRLPDNNVKEFHTEKAREQWAITKQVSYCKPESSWISPLRTEQTYRTTPLIEPRPKVRRDWPMGSYLKYMEGPGWHDPPKQIMVHEGKMKLLSQVNQVFNLSFCMEYQREKESLYSNGLLNIKTNILKKLQIICQFWKIQEKSELFQNYFCILFTSNCQKILTLINFIRKMSPNLRVIINQRDKKERETLIVKKNENRETFINYVK